MLGIIEKCRFVFYKVNVCYFFGVKLVHLFLIAIGIIPFMDQKQIIVIWFRIDEAAVHSLDIFVKPVGDKLDHFNASAILPDLPLLRKELGFEKEEKSLLSDDLRLIAKAQIQSLVVDIAAIFALLLRLYHVPLLQLLSENALAIVFDLDVAAALDSKRVLRVQIINDVFINAPVFLNVLVVLTLQHLDHVLIKTVLLMLQFILNVSRRLKPPKNGLQCNHFNMGHPH